MTQTTPSDQTMLMLARFFPPAQSAGTFRVVRFTQFLPEFGWKCVVGTLAERCHPEVDPTLMASVPPGTEVHRWPCGNWETHLDMWADRRKGTIGRLTALPARYLAGALRVGITPDTGKMGLRGLYRGVSKALGSQRIDAVLITGMPFSWFFLAPKIKKQFGVPVVLDLRDPWTHFPDFFRGRRAWRLGVDRRNERRIFSCVDRVIFNTPRTLAWYCGQYPDLDQSGWSVITNGFTAGQVEAATPEPFDTPVLVHGGMTDRIRTSKFLIEAMGRCRDAGVISPETFRYISYGSGEPGEHAVASRAGVEEMVEFRGRASHGEVLAALRGAKALLLVVAEGHTLNVPGKLYEYLGANKPIIMAGPVESDAADILARTGAGRAVPIDDVSALATAIGDVMMGRLGAARDDQAVAQYEARTLTGKLADLLDQVAGRRGGNA
ncbi:MAG: glycosyltransferase [Planctomycetota bacterium]